MRKYKELIAEANSIVYEKFDPNEPRDSTDRKSVV